MQRNKELVDASYPATASISKDVSEQDSAVTLSTDQIVALFVHDIGRLFMPYLMLVDVQALRATCRTLHNHPKIIAAFNQMRKPIEVFLGYDHTIILNNGFCYGFGGNYGYQLGLGSDPKLHTDIKRPTNIKINSTTNAVLPIQQVITGFGCTFFQSRGKWYNCGRVEGYPWNTSPALNPDQQLEMLNGPITDIRVGYNGHTFIRDTERWFALGRNDKGQLGLGDNNHRDIPTPLTDFEMTHGKIDEVVLGYFHSFIRINKGWYAFGENRCGELGLGDTQDRSRPTSLIAFERTVGAIKKIIAGHMKTFILTNQGWFACGINVYGQLGTGDTINRSSPIPLTTIEDRFGRIEDIAPTPTGTFFLINGQWHSLGCNDHGQLALETSSEEPVLTLISLANIEARYGKIECIRTGWHRTLFRANNIWYATGQNPHFCNLHEVDYIDLVEAYPLILPPTPPSAVTLRQGILQLALQEYENSRNVVRRNNLLGANSETKTISALRRLLEKSLGENRDITAEEIIVILTKRDQSRLYKEPRLISNSVAFFKSPNSYNNNKLTATEKVINKISGFFVRAMQLG